MRLRTIADWPGLSTAPELSGRTPGHGGNGGPDGQAQALGGAAARPGRVQPEPALDRLTPRQRDVLGLLVEGRSNKEIARALDLGQGTVKIHLAALFRHLGVHNRAAAVAAAAPLLAKG